VAFIVEKDKPFVPVDVGLLGPITQVPDPMGMPHLVEEFRLDHPRLLM